MLGIVYTILTLISEWRVFQKMGRGGLVIFRSAL